MIAGILLVLFVSRSGNTDWLVQAGRSVADNETPIHGRPAATSLMERSAWWRRLRSQFPLCDERAYLFPGSHGPLALDARQAIEAVIDVWDRDPAGIHISEGRHVDACAEAVAALTGLRRLARRVREQHVRRAQHRRGHRAEWLAPGRRPAANVVLHTQSHAASTYAWLNAVRLGEPLEIRIAEREPGEDAIDAHRPPRRRARRSPS